ncbi:MAG TPA: sensor histidine kinase [Ilumatobacter sp.]|nr:sensor histidine kinase [Ilumatobacter sp.]
MDARAVNGERARFSPRVVDAGLAGFVIVVVVAAIAADVEGEPHPSRWFAFAFAVVLGGLMLWRRDRPVLVLAATLATLFVYYAFGFPPVGVAPPVAAAVYSVAESGRLRVAIGAALGIVTVSFGYRIGEGDEDLTYLLGYELTSAVTLLAAVIALGDAVRSRRTIRADGHRRSVVAERERARETEWRVEQERVRIARELHDVLAHTMSVISIQADLAAEAVDDDLPQARGAIDTIRQTSRRAGKELRAALGAVREPGSAARRPVPGIDDIARLVTVAAESGLVLDVTTTGTPIPLPAVVDAAAHRIVQEAVTNVMRHAHTDHALLHLCYRPDALGITVTDHGTGPIPTGVAVAGYGLVGMRERAHLLGGTLAAGPAPAGGFRVHAEIPLEHRVVEARR